MNVGFPCAVSLALIACGAPQKPKSESSLRDGIYVVRITSATIESRRPDGSPWHVSAADPAAVLVEVATGVAAGNAEIGAKVGDSLGGRGGEPEAPMPYVVIKLAGASWTIGPGERSYSPAWNQPVEIRTWSHRGDELVVIQVLDAVDNELLAQGTMSLAKLLSAPTQTLTGLEGSVPTLDLEVAETEKSELDSSR